MPKVSIIVPAYNVEEYIETCICSVLAQSFTDWELILINDGSTDNSGTICDEYSNKDNRIQVIHKPNTGVSDTRNRGLDIAQGKYILFLDADDYWYEKTALETLVLTAEKHNLDIVRGEYKAVDKNGNDIFERPLIESKKEFSEQVLTSGFFYTKIMCGENFLVLSLIKRNAIGSLRLNNKRSFLEDMEFYAHLLLQPLRCMFIPIRFYAYRKIASSASHTPKIKNLADSFSMCQVFDNCTKLANDNELHDAYRYNSVMMFYWTLNTISSEPYYTIREEIIKDLNLNELRKKVKTWEKDSKEHFPLIIKLPTKISINMLRLKHSLGKIVRNFIPKQQHYL